MRAAFQRIALPEKFLPNSSFFGETSYATEFDGKWVLITGERWGQSKIRANWFSLREV
jgi:hypothetical protein